MIWVKNAHYLGEYKISLLFNTGENRTIDLKDFLDGEVFEPLKNQIFFKKFSLEGDTLSWENGADFAPEFLYEMGR